MYMTGGALSRLKMPVSQPYKTVSGQIVTSMALVRSCLLTLGVWGSQVRILSPRPIITIQ